MAVSTNSSEHLEASPYPANLALQKQAKSSSLNLKNKRLAVGHRKKLKHQNAHTFDIKLASTVNLHCPKKDIMAKLAKTETEAGL